MSIERTEVQRTYQMDNGGEVGTLTAEHKMSPVKEEFQRGWGVVFASSVGAAFGVLSAPSALAFMMKPLHDEFGWGRSQVAAAATCLTIGIFLAGPWFGRIYDRYGVRRVAPFAIVIFSCLLLAVSRMPNSLWTFYAAYFALGTLGVGTSFVAYSRAVAASSRRPGASLWR